MVALGKRGRGVNPYVVVEIFSNALSSWWDCFPRIVVADGRNCSLSGKAVCVYAE